MVRFGTVRFFDSCEGKLFGFIDADDGGSIFFHADDRCDCGGGNWIERDPQTGDRVAFRVSEDWNGRPKACPWTFESEYRPKLKEGEPLRIHLRHLPLLEHWDLESNDVCVASREFEGNWGRGPRKTWIEVILRSRTGELFQLRCWEGDFGGETTPDRAFRYVPVLEVRFPRHRQRVEQPELLDEAA